MPYKVYKDGLEIAFADEVNLVDESLTGAELYPKKLLWIFAPGQWDSVVLVEE